MPLGSGGTPENDTGKGFELLADTNPKSSLNPGICICPSLPRLSQASLDPGTASWPVLPSQHLCIPAPSLRHLPPTQISASNFTFPTPYSNDVEVGVSSAAQGGQGGLENPPCRSLAAACTAHDHGGVAGALGFIQLDDLGEGERCNLQAHFSNLVFDGLLQLREGETQEVEEKGRGLQRTFKSPQCLWKIMFQLLKNSTRTLCTLAIVHSLGS